MNEDRRNEIHDKSISDFYVVWWMEKKNVFRRKIVEKTTCPFVDTCTWRIN